MVLRKKTIDNSLRYIPIRERTKETDIKQKTIKIGSLPCEQNKYISQNNKKFIENLAAGGFATLTQKYLFNYNIITFIQI